MRHAPAPASGYLAELDGLRGIAITLVMIHRLYPRISAGRGSSRPAGSVSICSS
jgi:peptidoglycan/LPS O-acetylase OafA/YrhL